MQLAVNQSTMFDSACVLVMGHLSSTLTHRVIYGYGGLPVVVDVDWLAWIIIVDLEASGQEEARIWHFEWPGTTFDATQERSATAERQKIVHCEPEVLKFHFPQQNGKMAKGALFLTSLKTDLKHCVFRIKIARELGWKGSCHLASWNYIRQWLRFHLHYKTFYIICYVNWSFYSSLTFASKLTMHEVLAECFSSSLYVVIRISCSTEFFNNELRTEHAAKEHCSSSWHEITTCYALSMCLYCLFPQLQQLSLCSITESKNNISSVNISIVYK